ncbi:hypothetical protein D3C87_1724260 [compost metagenome]
MHVAERPPGSGPVVNPPEEIDVGHCVEGKVQLGAEIEQGSGVPVTFQLVLALPSFLSMRDIADAKRKGWRDPDSIANLETVVATDDAAPEFRIRMPA